ncbi:MAG: hypothetical protein ACRDRR_08540 [Pseudonocardiaceae bacterium]
MRRPAANKTAESGHRRKLDEPLAPITEWDTPTVVARKWGMPPPFTPQEFIELFGVIEPATDPIGPAEQVVIDAFAQRLGDAQAKVDAALVAYTTAQQAWFDARRAEFRARSTTSRPTDRRGIEIPLLRAAAKATSAAEATYEAACERLRRFRRGLTTVERRQARARLVARRTDEYGDR